MRYFLPVLLVIATAGLAQTPVPADSLFVSAVVNLKAAKFAQAEADFRRVTVMEPDRLRGHLGVAQVYLAQRKTDGALTYLRAESEKLPMSPDLRVAIGDTAVRGGQYDIALVEFQGVLAHLSMKSAIELDVPRGAAGGTLLTDPRADPLSESLRVLTVQDYTPKGAAGIYLRLAEVYRLRLDHTASVIAWQKTAELLPGKDWVLANLGLEQETAGQIQDAMKSYRATLELNPNNALILNNLAYLMADHGGDLYEALRFARRAGNLVPDSLEILDTQGWIALRQGFGDDAVGTFVRIIRKQPDRPEFRKHLALALAQTGPHSAGRDALIEALNRPPVAGDTQKILTLLNQVNK